MRPILIAIAVLLAGCPDRNSPERKMRRAVESMMKFKDQMCACKDKACADKVQEGLTNWAEEMAKDASSMKDHKPDETMMKKMTEVATQYGECMTKAMTSYEYIAPARTDIPPASQTSDADVLVREARAWARTNQPQHYASTVQMNYVDSNGVLDAQYGVLEIAFGRTRANRDDPKRKIGAPVVQNTTPEDCFQLTWKHGTGWDRTSYGCSDAFDVGARCTVKQIWKQAIARKAPAEALASVSWHASANGGFWELRIQDQPRQIDIVEPFSDDCPLAVEK